MSIWQYFERSCGSFNEITEHSLWLALRSARGDYIFAYLQINQIEEFEEGANSGDYLLSVAIDKSFRAASRTAGNMKFIEDFKSLPLGISKISVDTDLQIRQTVLTGVTVNFRQPTASDLNKIEIPPRTSDLEAWTLRCLASVKKKYSLDEIWSVQSLKLPPFAAFAYFRIVELLGKETGDLVLDLLRRDDPTVLLIAKNNSMESLKIAPPVVDTNLFLLDPSKIFARKFIAKKKEFISVKDILAKIEAAEKTHQKMLRIIAEYLITRGIQPRFSESIDICIEGSQGVKLFEIKSSTNENLLDQVAKGLFQLICYADALEREGRIVSDLILIVQKGGSASLEEYADRIAKKCGVKILFFDENRTWPEKVAGLVPMLALN